MGSTTIRAFVPNRHVESDIDDDTPIEDGEDIILQVERGKTKIYINLSEFNTDELDAFRKALDAAITEAAPVVAERDRIAREAIERDENPYYRSLRPAPSVSLFPGRVRRNP
jgi:hypothetical protein